MNPQISNTDAAIIRIWLRFVMPIAWPFGAIFWIAHRTITITGNVDHLWLSSICDS